MKKIFNSERGFTLVELGIVFGIIALLFGFVTLNLGNVQKVTSINSVIDTLVSDMKSQQTKAMAGAGGSGAGESYGIYFQSDRYILFTGTTYSSTNSSNFIIVLGGNIEFVSSTFADNSLVFLRQSGELSGFTDGMNTIAIQNIQGLNKKTITVNRYGVVTKIN
jgi:type II secretory pathway pseudopilin PulG